MNSNKLNSGLIEAQRNKVIETEKKISIALKKQAGRTKINITKLAADSGVSRQQIMRKYQYLYEGRQNESYKVSKLKDELNFEIKKNKNLAQINCKLEVNNKELREKLLELNIIIMGLSKKLQHAKIEPK